MDFTEKRKRIKGFFSHCTTAEERYATLIALGRDLSTYPSSRRTPDRRVEGCQSTVYLDAKRESDLLFFQAEADALISAGLVRLLIDVYSGEPPATLLTEPPTYLEELGIPGALTPSRANGLYSIHLRMKQEALGALVNKRVG